MRISVSSFPCFCNRSMLVVGLLLAVGAGFLSLHLLKPHVSDPIARGAAVIVAAIVFWAWRRRLVARGITFGLAILCGLSVHQYDSGEWGVRYFLVGKDEGMRYFRGWGRIGFMESTDWFNEEEFQTLKSGGRLAL
jgi:hypothetical protein